MSKKESPIVTFTRKLKEHKAFKDCPNKKMIYLIYLKMLISEPFRLVERKKYKKLNKKYDKIDPERSPVFIIGHWRSGTTYIHNLLSMDPSFFYQNKYQNFFSDNFLTTEDFFKPVLSKMMSSTSPVKNWKAKAHKTMNMDTPSESDTALISEISEFTYHWGHLFPKACKQYFDKYLFLENISEKELSKWKQTMHHLLNKVYLKNNKGRLLIKNPGDTARIKQLLDLYPDAKFIFIHRNPYDVFYSNLKLWTNVLDTVALQKISEKEKKDIVLNVYHKLHQKYLEQKDLLKSNQLVEVSYDDLTGFPLNTLHQIYEKLELPEYNKAIPFFKPYIEETTNWRKSEYNKYSEDIKDINNQWDFAFKLWQYQKLDPEEHAGYIAG
ncbi:MAG: sulfotransferase family protein [Bacteroidota bacterium]